jgi:hypothetical protein
MKSENQGSANDSCVDPDRRQFVRSVGCAVATAASTAARLAPLIVSTQVRADKYNGRENEISRDERLLKIRNSVDLADAKLPTPDNHANQDEELYPNKLGNYHKGLPHDEVGEVYPPAYQSMKDALRSGRPANFEKIILGGSERLSNPQGGLAFDLQGCDSHKTFMPAPPALASAERAAEMVEDYWMALLRDVNFSEYAQDLNVAVAIAELNHVKGFSGPMRDGQVTAQTLFRGFIDGDLVGPYVSQFLLQRVKFGALDIDQRYSTYVHGVDYLTNPSSWLSAQDGVGPFPANWPDSKPRFVRNGRDISAYVHVDGPFQAYLTAAQWLLANKVRLNPGNPYNRSFVQSGFGTFGQPHLLSLLAEGSNNALKAVWYHKWFVHRTLRPEAYGGLVHWMMNGVRQYPLHAQVLNSAAAAGVFNRFGTYLLPLAYPEGCPQHPSYGQGHAAIGGACVTILKAFFDTDSQVIPHPVRASSDGLSLIPYTGHDKSRMTLTNELNKLASNIGMARNFAGIHWRSDCHQALLLGETIAINMLQDQKATFNESFGGFTFTKFDGTRVTVGSMKSGLVNGKAIYLGKL